MTDIEAIEARLKLARAKQRRAMILAAATMVILVLSLMARAIAILIGHRI